ncbi:MAG: NUDIX domain-containing protein [Candidatus Paceibacterota bacterium]
MPHIHDKIDYTVEVFIVSENKVLLHMHQKLNKWLSIGGHIELDEDPIEAAHREVKEEMGIEIELITASDPVDFPDGPRELGAPQFLNRNPIAGDHEHITFVYLARPKSTDLKPEETITEWKWFGREEIEQNHVGIPENVQFYALKALDMLSS